MDEVHGQHNQPHGDAERDDADRFAQGDEFGGGHGADGDADGDDALEHRGLGKPEVERDFGPLDDDELQRRAGAPEERGDGQRDLAQAVAPEQGEAVVEFVDQEPRVFLQDLVVDAGVRHVKIEAGSQDVEHGDDREGHFADRVDTGLKQREIEDKQMLGDFRTDQRAADNDAEDDGADSQTLDPAVSDNEQAVRQVFGQDAVLGRRVGGGAKADNGVGEQRMGAKEHHAAADDLDAVADQHDPAFRHRVGKGADEGGENDVGNGEEGFEQWLVFGWCVHLAQGGDGGDQEGIVGQRGKKLRGHDDVEAERHEESVSYITLGEVYTTPSIGYKYCVVVFDVHRLAFVAKNAESVSGRLRLDDGNSMETRGGPAADPKFWPMLGEAARNVIEYRPHTIL